MKLKFHLLLAFFIAFFPMACDMIHEFPEQGKEVDPTEVDVKVQIKCKLRISQYDIVTKSGDPLSPEADSAYNYQRRFLVDIRSAEYTDTLVESHLVTCDVKDTSDLIIETKLKARKYKIIVWMDYVKKGTTKDLYYLTSNGKALNSIHLPSAEKYVGSSEFKDAQTVIDNIDLTPFAGQWYADITIPVQLIRPVAKITLLANDFAEYAASIGYMGPLSKLAGEIITEISYDGYFPTGFNALSGRLNDAEAGYGFKSYSTYPYALEQKEYTRIGFDYVLVNNDKSSVTISVKIRSKSGQIINEVNSVVVPVIRGRETVVIYKFFTKEYVPGIGIDPGFDGEFNVYV